MNIVNLRWDGLPSVKAARGGMRNGDRVDIDLPLETHHALFRHLNPDAPRGPDEDIDASGGVELLERIATVAGLEEMARLGPAVRRARYGVQLAGPRAAADPRPAAAQARPISRFSSASGGR